MTKIFSKALLRSQSSIILPFIITSAVVVTCIIIFQSYSAGPAKDSNQTVTGAPFNSSKTCSKCHSGGNFGGGITLQLLDATNTAVTSYVPGSKYTFKISMTHTTGSPKYGFQTTAAFTSSSNNYNNWGTLPSNIHNTTVSGRNYVEQSNTLNTPDILIPWTAPASGSGSLTFYTAGNLVNGTGGTSGDQPVNTSLTVNETTLPVSILYFKGAIQNNNAILSWATAQETNNKEFVIEKSIDGKTFFQAAVIPAQGNNSGHNYQWTDISFKNAAYYRLTQTDLDGKSTVYNIVDLKTANPSLYDITLYTHGGGNFILFYNGYKQQQVIVSCYDMQGRALYTNRTTAIEGNNMYSIPSAANGVVIMSVTTEDGIKTSKKFLVTR